MLSLSDTELLAHKDRIVGKIVVITGAAKGIGRESALLFASQGAKVVIGDLDSANGHKVVAEVEATGGKATFVKTDVVVWEDQVALFNHAIQSYGAVDVVVVNAGVAEKALSFGTVVFEDGKPAPPRLLTIDVNVKGALYTAHLSQHYLTINRKEGDMKTLIVIGSMASWTAVPFCELYTASKHAMLGLMRTMHMRLRYQGIRVACVHPWFAATDILSATTRLLLAGIPLTTVPRIAGAILCAATDPDEGTDGCSWTLADDGDVVVVQKEDFKKGVYQLFDDRVNSLTRGVNGLQFWVNFIRDVWKILVIPRLGLAIVLLLAIVLPWYGQESLLQMADPVNGSK